MNLLPDPFALHLAAEAEWELAADLRIVEAASERIRDVISEGRSAADAASAPGWFGAARSAFDAREAELQTSLGAAEFELDALAAELRGAAERLRLAG